MKNAEEANSMEIRNLTSSQYDQITALWCRADLPYKPKGRDSKESIQAEMKANPDFFLGAFENNKLIGVVVVTCDGRKGWLNRLAVDPNFRRRGIAQALIREAEKATRKRGIKVLCALIEDYNKGSATFQEMRLH